MFVLLKISNNYNIIKQTLFFIRKYVAFFLVLFCTKSLSAQETIVTYMKKNGSFTAQKDSADYTRILRISPNSLALYELNEYYPNGSLKRHGWVKTLDPKRLQFEGTVETYYDNETLAAILNYAQNKLVDTAKRYYKNGVLKESIFYLKPQENQESAFGSDPDSRLVYYADSLNNVQITNGKGTARFVDKDNDVEQGEYADGVRIGHWKGTINKGKYKFEEWYEKGIIVNGETTDSLGKKIKYTKVQVQPEYPGGIQQLRMFIGNNYKYPREAIGARVVGQVTISFVVEKDGKTSSYKIIDDLGYGTGNAGVAVLKKAKDWSPGYERGIPVRVAYTLPIRLNLTK
ncbi:TonB protein C-terminal [Sphingobacterium nematocida]|uniref:TonB protein C-terminal n=1 Tax=Sphingobacterium nematocida TaxID=1513896 RepID=A0A1T5FBR2_9SPHI|nr:energy transducer TonB [Sphingobacterium nematocida]SKB93623.1 TonB protein C-terminal [Sphingobacterium nematocida]